MAKNLHEMLGPPKCKRYSDGPDIHITYHKSITWFRNGSNLLQLRGYVQCHKG